MSSARLAALVFALVPVAATAVEAPPVEVPAAARAKRTKSSEFIFSLLPKSLQKNPRLDFNIFTEMTADGRRLKPPTPQQPAYYVAQPGGMRNTGVGAEEGLKSPPPEQLQRMMEKALAEGGYLATDETAARRPTVAIIYHWGSSSFQPPADVSDENGEGNVPVPEFVLRKTLLNRAMLLGGAKFTKEVSDAMEEIDRMASLTRAFVAPEGGGDFMASPMAGMQDPFDRLRSRGAEMERLVDELFSSSFFVVASAYDYAAMAKGQRRLLWRTKMTVNSLGVNMAESVPPLIASAAPYLGRETSEPVVVTKRIGREGRVEVGTPTVVPDAAAAPNAEKK